AAGTQETTEQAEAPSEDVADETAEDEAAAEDATAEDAAVEDEEETAEEADVPADHASALTQAESYSDTMHMSKQAIFDQLTSEYGGQLPRSRPTTRSRTSEFLALHPAGPAGEHPGGPCS